MRRAESNLVQARQRQPGICLEDLCFHAQQAAEKSLKALLLAQRRGPAYTHNLATLLRLIKEARLPVPQDVMRVVRLSDYAVETRYPGMFDPVTEQDYREAMELASRCVAWVRDRLSGTKSDT